MRSLFLSLAMGAAVSLAGCSSEDGASRPPAQVDAHDHGHDHHGHSHGHSHDEGPHEGEVVVIGDHQYHVEWTHDDESGEVALYLLDSEMKNPVSIDQDSLTIQVTIGDQTREHTLVADASTGEADTASRFVVVDKSLIEAMKLAGKGVAVTMSLPIGGQTLTVDFAE